MSIQTEAEENLRVIRSLMQKATVYRAISAPGALIGGAGALGLAIVGNLHNSPFSGRSAPGLNFLLPWISLLVVTSIVNLVLLARDAARREEPFVSQGMRLALRAMLPALLGGGIVILPTPINVPELLAAFWVLFYGISLLAASHFAPKSICWLGRAFFVAGFLLLGAISALSEWWMAIGSTTVLAHTIMGATFGLFHLIYAACTWPRRGTVRQEP